MKGISFTLTTVVLGLVILATALTVVVGSGESLQKTFSWQEEGVSEEECRLQLGKVRAGRMEPESVDPGCRETVSEEEWNQIRNSYIQERTSDDLLPLLKGG